MDKICKNCKWWRQVSSWGTCDMTETNACEPVITNTLAYPEEIQWPSAGNMILKTSRAFGCTQFTDKGEPAC